MKNYTDDSILKMEQSLDCFGLVCLYVILMRNNRLVVPYHKFKSLHGMSIIHGLSPAVLNKVAERYRCKLELFSCENTNNIFETSGPKILLVQRKMNSNRMEFALFIEFINNKFLIGFPGWGVVPLTEGEVESIWTTPRYILTIESN